MSRIGNKLIQIPDKVKVSVNSNQVMVEGPLGKKSVVVSPHVAIKIDGKVISLTRSDESREARQSHGTARAILQNEITGLSTGFQKILDIQGVGYKAEVKGNDLHLVLGFSHPVVYKIPTGIKVVVEKLTRLIITGSSKDLLGEVAATIRALRPPEPYKGKGIRYENEVIQRKVGKAAAGGGK